jgi:hypothetical protein
MLKVFFLIAYILVFLCAGSAGAQDIRTERRTMHATDEPGALYAELADPPYDNKSAKQILDIVEKSIAENNLQALSPLFASKVYLSLLTGKEGYFSAEQTFFILKNFFLTYTPIAFAYSNSSPASDNPYGVGTLQYMNRGQRGKAQLFVSLTRTRNDWRISQITITNR